MHAYVYCNTCNRLFILWFSVVCCKEGTVVVVMSLAKRIVVKYVVRFGGLFVWVYDIFHRHATWPLSIIQFMQKQNKKKTVTN